VRELTIGRAPSNAVQLVDPSVSRLHAVISPTAPGGPPLLRDAGSSHGTWVDGKRLGEPLRLHDGARIELGDQELVLERRRREEEAGRTVLVPAGASLVVPATGDPQAGAEAETRFGAHPRLRSGFALKRLEAAEGSQRWVLKDTVGESFVRLADSDARLLRLLDGRHGIGDLILEAERVHGDAGPARVARLLADLGARGLLAGSQAPSAETRSRARLLQPRRRAWPRAGRLFERLYLGGGWLLFTRLGIAAIGATIAAGLAAFGFLIAARYGTPFVVAHKVALGALVFVAGRLLVVAAHETAHGLAMSSFGRQVGEVGVKLVLIFPYAYVDTSDAWFEPRSRRIAVSAAGPVSDLALGGAFALVCLAAPAGATRDVFFQLAFGAYLGALFNLNPLLERDGYQILVDVLREPGLRPRALDHLRRRLAGRGGAESRLLGRYALWSFAWTLMSVALGVAMSLRYEQALAATTPHLLLWVLFGTIWAAMLAVPLAIVGPPLRERFRSSAA
jgi:putative peptide zinc metalloprotease protein